MPRFSVCAYRVHSRQLHVATIHFPIGRSEKLDQVYLVSEKTTPLQQERQFGICRYVWADKKGSVTGMLWNANDHVYGSFENGDYLRVQGTAQLYNGTVQIIVNRLDRVPATKSMKRISSLSGIKRSPNLASA